MMEDIGSGDDDGEIMSLIYEYAFGTTDHSDHLDEKETACTTDKYDSKPKTTDKKNTPRYVFCRTTANGKKTEKRERQLSLRRGTCFFAFDRRKLEVLIDCHRRWLNKPYSHSCLTKLVNPDTRTRALRKMRAVAGVEKQRRRKETYTCGDRLPDCRCPQRLLLDFFEGVLARFDETFAEYVHQDRFSEAVLPRSRSNKSCKKKGECK